MANFDDFLKPESMVTPGIAGGITMMISNTLWFQFALPQRWTGLVVSFALGMLVFIAGQLSVWQRCVYYVINSLIIFSMAAGSNYVGMTVTQGSGPPHTASALSESTGFLSWLVVPSPANAQDPAKEREESLERLRLEVERLRLELQQLKNRGEVTTSQREELEEELKNFENVPQIEKSEAPQVEKKQQRKFFGGGF